MTGPAGKEQGFTLIEILIVCVVFAILAILATRVGLHGVRSALSLLEQTGGERRAVVALHRMVKDIGSWAPSTAEKLTVDGRTIDGRAAANMALPSRGRLFVTQNTDKGVALIAYETRKSPQGLALYRRESEAGKRPQPEEVWHLLVDGLDAVRIDVEDVQGGQHQSWPPESGSRAAIPALVRVSLSFSQGKNLPSWALTTSVALRQELAGASK